MLRVVRNLFQDPVITLFEVFDQERIVHFICGTCLIHIEHTRRLTKDRLDTLSIPYFVFTKRSRHGNFCEKKAEAQREHRQAKVPLKKFSGKGYSSIFQRSHKQDTFRDNPNQSLDGTEIFADIWTRSRTRITHILPRDTSGNGTKTTGSLR